ncbi:hypothetical protein HPB48_018081 [Haemaphysalis longicornis]|uniref:Uncharacterized protein n=1 Tax=Haemaphysalis longicornis TaxID=44386 RepID=A0A9J6FVV0_HAELO|nr:hypothetical protein HPB48_018081 [Haemaphysalis longicornis]
MASLNLSAFASFIASSSLTSAPTYLVLGRSFKTCLSCGASLAHALTEQFLALGLHNTVTELLETHRTAQITRLSQTPTGRCILERARISTHPFYSILCIHVIPLPRNMNPTFHIGRCLARPRDHLRHYSPSPNVLYVDAGGHAAEYPSKPAFAIAVIAAPGADPQASATVLTST